MVKVTQLTSQGKRKAKWPETEDFFQFKTDNGDEYHGLVISNKKKIGPFEDALIIMLFKKGGDELSDIDVNHDLLLPPIITDNSCWKHGMFTTIGKREIQEDLINNLVFINPLNNKAYDVNDGVFNGNRVGLLDVERSLCFFDDIKRKIEKAIS